MLYISILYPIIMLHLCLIGALLHPRDQASVFRVASHREIIAEPNCIQEQFFFFLRYLSVPFRLVISIKHQYRASDHSQTRNQYLSRDTPVTSHGGPRRGGSALWSVQGLRYLLERHFARYGATGAYISYPHSLPLTAAAVADSATTI